MSKFESEHGKRLRSRPFITLPQVVYDAAWAATSLAFWRTVCILIAAGLCLNGLAVWAIVATLGAVLAQLMIMEGFYHGKRDGD